MKPRTAGPVVTMITGLSGAGRSEAARCLEDLGYFVV
ncbi:MAG TPA: RNase adapter RapZ, partial [Actinomycetota bacterium]